MITKSAFGKLSDGREASLYTMTGSGITVEVSDFGGRIVSVKVPDRHGSVVDVVFGYENAQGYIADRATYHGALIGRVANRIAGGSFELNGRVYNLYVNNGPNCLHGGKDGFDMKLMSSKILSDTELELSLVSGDGEEGFPGRLELCYTIELVESGFSIRYKAVSDADTVCNLTNHAYFNLSGGGEIYDHSISINAQRYLVPDEYLIPVSINSVADTPFDLRRAVSMGDFIAPGKAIDGYDHCFEIDGAGLREAGTAASSKTGIKMSVSTDMPGMQLYTGNSLNGATGKSGVKHDRHCAFCFETSFFPDAVHHPEWRGSVLKKGELYDYTTIFRFSR